MQRAYSSDYADLVQRYTDQYKAADGWPDVYAVHLDALDIPIHYDGDEPQPRFYRTLEDAARAGCYFLPFWYPTIVKVSVQQNALTVEEMTTVTRGEAFKMRVERFSNASALALKWGRSRQYVHDLINGKTDIHAMHWRALEAEEARHEIRPVPVDPMVSDEPVSAPTG